MLLSVIIPVYNEKNTLERIVKKVLDVPVEKEVLIIDDCSTDGTREILKSLHHPHIRVFYHEVNKGKGAAIRTGISKTRGDIILIQDADLEYDPGDYPALLEPIISGETDVVYGSRLINKQQSAGFIWLYGGKLLTLLTNILYNAHITDEPTCYKVFKADVLKNIELTCMRFEFCPEVTAKIRRKNIRIKEVPIRYYPRSKAEGKKIGFRDGIQAIWILFKYRFTK